MDKLLASSSARKKLILPKIKLALQIILLKRIAFHG